MRPANKSQGNEKLLAKYELDINFKEQMDKQTEKYEIMKSEAYYSDISMINEEILTRFDLAAHELYFFYGFMYNSGSINIHKLTLFLVRHFNPKPQKPYSFVFFNHDAKVDTYGQIKSIFLGLSFPHYMHLNNIFLIRPSFYHKAQDFIAYNYLPSFLKSKTIHLGSAKDLCKKMGIIQQNFVDFVPQQIATSEFPDLKPRNLGIADKRINFEGQFRTQEEKESQQNFEKDMKAFLFIKNGKQVYNIEDYELSKLGIPIILQLLVYYFKSHPDGLKLEGLFRKSVSIDEENETLNELANKNYDYLLEVKNPHIVANLIKRFFANLKTPVIPYPQFQKLMHDQGVKDKVQYIKEIINSIPEINLLSIMYVIGFFKQSVIPNEPYNKMTAQNIAICFAPCLMRAEVSGPADLIYASKCMAVNKIIIENFEHIFGTDEIRMQKLRHSEKEMINYFEEEVNQSILEQKKSSPHIRSPNPKSPQKESNPGSENSPRQKNRSKSKSLKKYSLCPTKIKDLCGKEGQKKHEVIIDKPPSRQLPSMKNIDKYRRKSEFSNFEGEKQSISGEKVQHRKTELRYIRLGEKKKEK